MEKDNTFVKITNKDIYEQIKKNHEENIKQHSEIITRLDKTNGKVKLAKWIGSTALGLIVVIIGFALQHLAQAGGK